MNSSEKSPSADNANEKLKYDINIYKELNDVKRLSPGGYLIEGSIFNHGQKNAYDQYKRYICYYNSDSKNTYCKAMAKQWLKSNRWFLIRGHSGDCKNKNLPDWEIQKFIDRVEKFYLTEGRRKGGFKTGRRRDGANNHSDKSNNINLAKKVGRRIGYKTRRRSDKCAESDEEIESESDEGEGEGEYFEANGCDPSINIGIDFQEAYRNALNELTNKNEEIKMLKTTIDKLVLKVEEERRLKERIKELLISMKVDKEN